MTSQHKNGTAAQHGDKMDVKKEVDWPNVLFIIHVYLIGIMSWAVFFEARVLTILFTGVLVFFGMLGMTAGAHRLWAHRAYEANFGLRVFLMLCQTLAGQGNIHDWVVKHRVHHKYFETDDDPYQVHKGFWNAHVFSLTLKKSKREEQLYKEIDTQDLENDAVVAFQRKFYWLLFPIVSLLLPINAPLEYWSDSLLSAIFITGCLRYFLTCQISWLIHSAIHIWGLKPNDKYPADTMLVFVLTKSHWLKYHYILPWDYQVGEFGGYGDGFVTCLIRGFAAFNWASDLKTVSSETIQEAVYNSTVSGKTINECVEDITQTKHTRHIPQAQFHSAKFL